MIIAAVASPTPSTIDTAFTNPSDLMRARVGETFAIVLDANPTTGYSWAIQPDNVLRREDRGISRRRCCYIMA